MPKYVLAALLLLAIVVIPASTLAAPATKFYHKDGKIFDEWNVCRSDATGDDGFFQVKSTMDFRPVIVSESLGDNSDVAYAIGQQIAHDYPDVYQRAERVFGFARDKVRYTSDGEQFGFDEFAQNADELAITIDDNGFAHGDCEDYAILLAVMYQGAGFRSAIALMSDHAATLVYLPGYDKANRVLSIDGEIGWIWAEATGGNNPLGWMPESFMGSSIGVCEVEDKAIDKVDKESASCAGVTAESGNPVIHISPFLGVVIVMLFFPLLRVRRRR
jgi:hypothetical protein